MLIKDIASVLNAHVCYENNLNLDISIAYASDMMADVLAFATPGCALVTGLRNPQVLRTAELKDLSCVIFCRNKIPTEEILEMAKESELCIMYTTYPVFTVCGMLYERGIRGVAPHE